MNKKKPKNMWGLWTKEYILVCFMGLMIFSSNQVSNSTTALYVEALGGNASYSGIYFALFTASALITRLFCGKIVDTRGCRLTALIGSSIMIIFTALFNLIPQLFAVGVWRFFQGIGYASAGTAFSTAVSMIVSSENLGRGISIYGLTQSIATTIGPYFALTLIVGDDFQYVYWFGSLLMVLAIVAIMFCDFPETQPKEMQKRDILPFREQCRIFAVNHLERRAFRPALVQMVNSITVSAVVFYIPLFAAGRFYATASLFFLVTSATMLITRLILARIINLIPHLYILLGCMLSGMAGMLLIAFSRTAFLFMLSAAFYGVMHGTSQPMLHTISIKNVPQARRGAATATFYISVDAGMGIGSLLWGSLIEHIPQMYIYIIAAAMLLICIILIENLLFPKIRLISPNCKSDQEHIC